MSQQSLRVGSRSSPLALAQVEEVFSLLKKAGRKQVYKLKTFQTKGDVDKTTSLLTDPADDFFTNTLDQALLKKEIDIAVHSAKDLSKQISAGLKVFALTETLDDTDALVGKLTTGSRIGTSSALRKEQILKLQPAAKIVDVRGTIGERLKLLDEGKLDALVVASCALKRLGLAKRIKEILPWEGTPLQGQLAVVGRPEDRELEKIFTVIDVRRKYGKVYLIGAGPGDPELITLKGVAALRKADCIFYDYLVSTRLLDHNPAAEKINVGKRKGNATLPQNELSRLLKEKAMAGKTVARLKGGDPLIFGRGADEISYLRSYHIEVEVIAGVTSATGIPSSLGIPLTARSISSSVAFVSGHGEDEGRDNPVALDIPRAQTLVFLMGLTKLAEIVKALADAGWPPMSPVAVISKGTCVDEKIVVSDLRHIEEKVKAADIKPPALIIAGETVKFFDRRYRLEGNFLYVGTYPERYNTLSRIVHFPMITISAARVANPKAVVSEVEKADIILLTSRCGAKYFVEFLAGRKVSLDILRLKQFVTIGKETERQLAMYGLSSDLVGDEETSEGLFKKMKQQIKLKGKKIIFPRSSIANPYLKTQLTKAGAKVREVVVYENTKPAKRLLPDEEMDGVIFSSPSTVANFLEDYKKVPEGWKIYAKGPRTQKALKEAGYPSEILVTE